MFDYRSQSMDRLMQAIAGMHDIEECYAFFDDLCTIKELQDMAQRFEAARLLSLEYSYQKIADKVGMSTATISRVNRCLSYGSGGYRAALERLKSEEEKNDNI